MTRSHANSLTILMATYQGEQFLGDQLQSFLDQSFQNWNLTISDDGSQDGTQDILLDFASKRPEGCVKIRRGARNGFCTNFLALACEPEFESDYYAFSDQDDIWERDKLLRAVSWLSSLDGDTPAVYCGRTLGIDESGNELNFSPCFRRLPDFRNAIVQNIGGGNTMVFNEAARRLIKKAGANIKVPSHDWWLYILVTGCGGKVKYDPEPMVKYRQHDNNLVGANTNLSARYVRIRSLLQGKLRDWTDQHIAALHEYMDILTEKDLEVIQTLSRARNSYLFKRLWLFYKAGIYRQSVLGNLGLWTAILLNKV